MGQNPVNPKKRIIKKRSSSGKSLPKTDRKTRSEIGGTFHFKARRDSMSGEEPIGHESGVRYRLESGRVVNFGGEVTARGEFGRDEKQELLALVENLGAAQAAKDSCDRIVRVKSTREGFVVQTSKPHLAVAIGKKLHRARKGGELTVTWSDRDLPVRVVWTA